MDRRQALSNQGEPWPMVTDPTKKLINAYEMGLDCGRNGPNETNCNFTIFSEEIYTLAWDLGKEKGMLDGKQESVPLEYGQRDKENGLLVIHCEFVKEC